MCVPCAMSCRQAEEAWHALPCDKGHLRASTCRTERHLYILGKMEHCNWRNWMMWTLIPLLLSAIVLEIMVVFCNFCNFSYTFFCIKVSINAHPQWSCYGSGLCLFSRHPVTMCSPIHWCVWELQSQVTRSVGGVCRKRAFIACANWKHQLNTCQSLQYTYT